MARKISQMTWAQVKEEMSIAGDPEKVAALGEEILESIRKKIDLTNRATLTNLEFMLLRLTAEIRLYQRMYDKSHG